MKNLAIIPARGGSKRIPKKNIKDFLGKPIIAYSIETALKSKLFDEVMVSTDDEEIAKIAIKFGAKVPFMRSKKNSDDYATLSDVIDEVISFYKKYKIKYQYACCILPTAPLITHDNLRKLYEIIRLDRKIDTVTPVVKFSYPIQRALKITANKIEMFYPEFKETRSQDLEDAFHDAGQFYWLRFEKGLRGENKFGIEINNIAAQDIDTVEDWKIAEFKYQYLFLKK